MHVYPAKSSKFESTWFCVRYNWWRRLQPTSSVSPLCTEHRWSIWQLLFRKAFSSQCSHGMEIFPITPRNPAVCRGVPNPSIAKKRNYHYFIRISSGIAIKNLSRPCIRPRVHSGYTPHRFQHYWSLVKEIHKSSVNFPHQWTDSLSFDAFFIISRNKLLNKQSKAGDIRRRRYHVMSSLCNDRIRNSACAIS